MRHLADLRLFYRTASHTPPAQLLERIRLIARRCYRQSLGPPRNFNAPPPQVRPLLPKPILPVREHQVSRDAGETWIDVIGHRVLLTQGLDWHPGPSNEWTHLRRFHLHYMEWCEALDDRDFESTIDSWITENPPYGSAYWFDSWNSYVISLRTVVWMQQLANRPGLPSRFVDRAVVSICHQIRVLFDHLELDLCGNHLVKNIKALIWASAFFQGPEADNWNRRACKLLSQVLDQQILPDGMHYELSASYHAQVFADLLECAEVLPESGLHTRLTDTFVRCARALVCVTHPDGGPALFNDSGLAMAYPADQVLTAAAKFTGYICQPEGAFCLPDAGYYGYRSGGDYFLIKVGQIAPDSLPAHGHADLLSFEWDVAGQRIVVDPGVSEYEPGPIRARERGTAAHNTLSIEGLDQCEMWSNFRVGRLGRARVETWKPEPDGFFLEASHDGYTSIGGSPIHHRRAAVSAGSIRIEDWFNPRNTRPVLGGVLFHPDCRVSGAGRHYQVEVGRQRIMLHSKVPGTIGESSWSPDMGNVRTTSRLSFDYGDLSASTAILCARASNAR